MSYTPALSEKFPTLEASDRILCFYINVTSRIQIIRLTNSPNQVFEKLVFPGERLMFEAIRVANLEVYYSETNYISVPCEQLRIIESFTDN